MTLFLVLVIKQVLWGVTSEQQLLLSQGYILPMWKQEDA